MGVGLGLGVGVGLGLGFELVALLLHVVEALLEHLVG